MMALLLAGLTINASAQDGVRVAPKASKSRSANQRAVGANERQQNQNTNRNNVSQDNTIDYGQMLAEYEVGVIRCETIVKNAGGKNALDVKKQFKAEYNKTVRYEKKLNKGNLTDDQKTDYINYQGRLATAKETVNALK